MSAVTLSEESIRQNGFYVPTFQLLVQNSGLPSDVVRDITQVTYHDNYKEIDGFEIVLNNWDDKTQSFKYVGSETQTTLETGARSAYFKLFEPCGKTVQLSMGYLGDLRVMLTGRFTTIEPNFPSGGPPTLNVRGLNLLNSLRTKQYTTVWDNKKDSEIAQNLDSLTDSETGKKRVPANIIIDPKSLHNETKLDYVAQENQFDIDFLLTRARQRGYVLVYDQGKKGSKPTLYFGPSQNAASAGRAVTFQLDWGKSLIDFKPTLTTHNQIKSVTVMGWNRRTKKPIVAKSTVTDSKFRMNRDIHRLITDCNPREQIVVHEPMFSPQEAQQRADAILSDRLRCFVNATATTVGLPDLRAGVNVQIGGLGSRFSGTYFVTDTTHTIGASGYTTRFNARREDFEGGKAS